MKPIKFKHKIFRESILNRIKRRLIKRAEEKQSVWAYKLLYKFKDFWGYLNNIERPILIISFFIFIFFTILIINKIQLKTVIVESKEVNKVLNEWNGRVNAIMFFGFWNWLYFAIAIICSRNIPNKPQGWF